MNFKSTAAKHSLHQEWYRLEIEGGDLLEVLTIIAG